MIGGALLRSGKFSAGLARVVLVIRAGLATPSNAQAPGYVFAKAGLIAGAGGGRRSPAVPAPAKRASILRNFSHN